MAKLHTNRQISVASVLLFLLGAFAIDPPEHRCRTQSTRNRQARTVRLDDHDGDHNRWHAYGFDNAGREKQGDQPVTILTAKAEIDPAIAFVGFVFPPGDVQLSFNVHLSPRGRAPPSFFNL